MTTICQTLNPKRVVALAAAAILLGACNVVDRLGDIGTEPKLTQIQNPVQQRSYKPVVLPMPRQRPTAHKANSLWRPGARAFFKDQRASQIGDILTVNITIADEATIDNETSRTRTNTEDSDLTNILGYEGSLSKILPEGVSASSLVSLGSDSSATGTGSINRKETVKLVVAAIVTQVLPNGNLVISGSQEVRVNFEKRILQVTGVVRPSDISATNTVKHTQVAEARISYGGRGQLTDVQQPRYGQQLFDVVFPF
ncbi:MAG: flagellar basal body L-ring protein FlgH [Alphaproteobacteria bacterium]|jgi:flagellar L-ring protein precursor FlgH|nr:flagellar basal body L-ring protein FlgH [Alphaproteobacteria bacterium]MDP6815753.1 flagellar basal body L-ring protein FlgH [Alphaproteobacteria bacterium]